MRNRASYQGEAGEPFAVFPESFGNAKKKCDPELRAVTSAVCTKLSTALSFCTAHCSDDVSKGRPAGCALSRTGWGPDRKEWRLRANVGNCGKATKMSQASVIAPNNYSHAWLAMQAPSCSKVNSRKTGIALNPKACRPSNSKSSLRKHCPTSTRLTWPV